MTTKLVVNWSVEEVSRWLSSFLNRSNYHDDTLVQNFKDEMIDGEALLHLEESHLERDLKVYKLGIRLKIRNEIQKFKELKEVEIPVIEENSLDKHTRIFSHVNYNEEKFSSPHDSSFTIANHLVKHDKDIQIPLIANAEYSDSLEESNDFKLNDLSAQVFHPLGSQIDTNAEFVQILRGLSQNSPLNDIKNQIKDNSKDLEASIDEYDSNGSSVEEPSFDRFYFNINSQVVIKARRALVTKQVTKRDIRRAFVNQDEKNSKSLHSVTWREEINIQNIDMEGFEAFSYLEYINNPKSQAPEDIEAQNEETHPAYGESVYDSDEYKELEGQEKGMKRANQNKNHLNPERNKKRKVAHPNYKALVQLSIPDIKMILDECIQKFVELWEKKELRKLEEKRHIHYKKLLYNNNLLNELGSLEKRIGDIREKLYRLNYYSRKNVIKNAASLEVSIFSRCEIHWKMELIQKSPPKKSIPDPELEKRTKPFKALVSVSKSRSLKEFFQLEEDGTVTSDFIDSNEDPGISLRDAMHLADAGLTEAPTAEGKATFSDTSLIVLNSQKKSNEDKYRKLSVFSQPIDNSIVHPAPFEVLNNTKDELLNISPLKLTKNTTNSKGMISLPEDFSASSSPFKSPLNLDIPKSQIKPIDLSGETSDSSSKALVHDTQESFINNEEKYIKIISIASDSGGSNKTETLEEPPSYNFNKVLPVGSPVLEFQKSKNPLISQHVDKTSAGVRAKSVPPMADNLIRVSYRVSGYPTTSDDNHISSERVTMVGSASIDDLVQSFHFSSPINQNDTHYNSDGIQESIILSSDSEEMSSIATFRNGPFERLSPEMEALIEPNSYEKMIDQAFEDFVWVPEGGSRLPNTLWGNVKPTKNDRDEFNGISEDAINEFNHIHEDQYNPTNNIQDDSESEYFPSEFGEPILIPTKNLNVITSSLKMNQHPQESTIELCNKSEKTLEKGFRSIGSLKELNNNDSFSENSLYQGKKKLDSGEFVNYGISNSCGVKPYNSFGNFEQTYKSEMEPKEKPKMQSGLQKSHLFKEHNSSEWSQPSKPNGFSTNMLSQKKNLSESSDKQTTQIVPIRKNADPAARHHASTSLNTGSHIVEQSKGGFLASRYRGGYKLKDADVKKVLDYNPITIFNEIKKLAKNRACEPETELKPDMIACICIWEEFMRERAFLNTINKDHETWKSRKHDSEAFIKFIEVWKKKYFELSKTSDLSQSLSVIERKPLVFSPIVNNLNQAERTQRKDADKERFIAALREIHLSRNNEDNYMINPGHKEDEDDIDIPYFLFSKLKDHQREGVRFIWKNIVMKNNGCVLAHSMGLGKTLQVIVFIYTLISTANSKPECLPLQLREPRILILCPLSVRSNWAKEFNNWIPDQYQTNMKITVLGRAGRETIQWRIFDIKNWYADGGILISNYHAFRDMLDNHKHENFDDGFGFTISHCLLNPGPDLVIADEGHIIKNPSSKISQHVKNIATPSKICLSGYPIQNNLMEFWCMVDFVYPNFLGPEQEFKSHFNDPISSAMYYDLLPAEKQLAFYRLHFLINILRNIVMREDNTNLNATLPPKTEYLISFHLSPLQLKLYKEYLELCERRSYDYDKYFLAKGQILATICNHPLVFKRQVDRIMETTTISLTRDQVTKEDIDFIELDEGGGNNLILKDIKMDRTEFGWVNNYFSQEDDVMKLELSVKFKALTLIMEATVNLNEKLLIFSQNLMTLDLIEDFIKHYHRSTFQYCRIDGSVSGQERQNRIDSFNSEWEKNVFLISTSAGAMGINLTSANRVVLFDIGWNPSFAEQAIGRIYRYGQSKRTYIYRLFTHETWEEVLSRSSAVKVALSDLVVDCRENNELLFRKDQRKYFNPPPTTPKVFEGDESYFDDPVLQKVVRICGKNIAAIKTNKANFSDISLQLNSELKNRIDQDIKNGAHLTDQMRSVGLKPSHPETSLPPIIQFTTIAPNPSTLRREVIQNLEEVFPPNESETKENSHQQGLKGSKAESLARAEIGNTGSKQLNMRIDCTDKLKQSSRNDDVLKFKEVIASGGSGDIEDHLQHSAAKSNCIVLEDNSTQIKTLTTGVNMVLNLPTSCLIPRTSSFNQPEPISSIKRISEIPQIMHARQTTKPMITIKQDRARLMEKSNSRVTEWEALGPTHPLVFERKKDTNIDPKPALAGRDDMNVNPNLIPLTRPKNLTRYTSNNISFSKAKQPAQRVFPSHVQDQRMQLPLDPSAESDLGLDRQGSAVKLSPKGFQAKSYAPRLNNHIELNSTNSHHLPPNSLTKSNATSFVRPMPHNARFNSNSHGDPHLIKGNPTRSGSGSIVHTIRPHHSAKEYGASNVRPAIRPKYNYTSQVNSRLGPRPEMRYRTQPESSRPKIWFNQGLYNAEQSDFYKDLPRARRGRSPRR